MRLIDIAKIEAFIAIVEAGSLLGASRASGIPRSTLRRQLTELEEQIGQELLHRKDGKLVPSGAGRVVLDRGRALLADSAGLLREAREAGDGLGRRLQFAMPPGMPDVLLRRTWPMASQRFAEPGRMRVVEDPLRALAEGSDVAVYVGSVPDGPWESISITTLHLELVASPDYLDRASAPATADDLAHHTILRWMVPGAGAADELPLCDGGAVSLRPRLVCNDERLLRQLVDDGAGIALLPRYDGLPPAGEGYLPVLPGVVGSELPVSLVVADEFADHPRPGNILGVIRAALAQLRAAAPSE